MTKSVEESIRDIGHRLRVLEAEAIAKGKPENQVKQLRAMAVKLNQRLTQQQRRNSKDTQMRFWLRTFAASAFPTTLLECSSHAHAAALAADAAYDLWGELESRFATDTGTDERKESQKTE